MGIQTDAASVRRADASVDRVKRGLGEMQSRARAAGSAIRGAILQAVGIGAAIRGAQGIGATLVLFDQLEARLETIEGGAEGAARSMERLNRFAAKTPFQIEQLVDGFSTLRVRGFEASDRTLTALGDTAAAFGQDFASMVDATSALLRGENDPIEKFGLSAKTSGDRVTLTFKGVSTTVKREAGAIEGYLTELGENNFAGAMERQSRTLGGVLSNLQDAFTQLVTKSIGGRASDPGSLRFALLELGRELTGTVGDAEGVARAFGRLLARGVRALTQGLRFLREHSDQVRAAFKVLLAVVAARGLLSGLTLLGGALTALGRAAFAAQAKLLLVPLALGALVLILQDLYVFLSGSGRSLIGEALGESGEKARKGLLSLKDGALELWDALKDLVDTVVREAILVFQEMGFDVEDAGGVFLVVAKGVLSLVTGLVKLSRWLIRVTRPIRLFITQTLVKLWQALKLVWNVLNGNSEAWDKASGKVKLATLAFWPLLTTIRLLSWAFEALGDWLDDNGDIFDDWTDTVMLALAPLVKTIEFIERGLSALGMVEQFLNPDPLNPVDRAIADRRVREQSGAGRAPSSRLVQELGGQDSLRRRFGGSAAVDAAAIRGALTPQAAQSMPGGQLRVDIGTLAPVVNVEGTVDMNMDDFEQRVESAAVRANQKAIQDAFEAYGSQR